jgi:hypothetical protein
MTKVTALENNDYFNVLYATHKWGDSSPIVPDDAILTSVFGSPLSFNTLVTLAVLINTANGEAWLCASSSLQNKWYYVQINEAV